MASFPIDSDPIMHQFSIAVYEQCRQHVQIDGASFRSIIFVVFIFTIVIIIIVIIIAMVNSVFYIAVIGDFPLVDRCSG